MKNEVVFSIGIMSGTSLDGIDLVYVKFNTPTYSNYEIIAAETIPYTDDWRAKLSGALDFSKEALDTLSKAYGSLLAKEVLNFITQHNIDKVDFIASHGHTILHQPKKGITVQIGDGSVMANETGIKVVNDFRTQDVALGGQGAPLVPVGDALLFSEYDYCLNLGGFANISYSEQEVIKAYDICPVNVLLNHYANELGHAYDDGGGMAATGLINEALLKDLNALAYYKKNAPKSLGIEWVHQEVFPIIKQYELTPNDILRTLVEHIAIQISNNMEVAKKILATGGGVYNDFLIKRVNELKQLTLVKPSSLLIAYKEALIFSLLGLLRINNQMNCLRSVTGASKDHCAGSIYEPKNF